MPDPVEVLGQLLSPLQAETLGRAGRSAWQTAASALESVFSALPSITEVDGRLVMPEEIAGEFGGPHLLLPIELSTAQDQTATAYLTLATKVAAAFLGSEADDPGDEEQQTIVMAGTVLGQVVQALNNQLFKGSPTGLLLSMDDVVANQMQGILESLDEPGLALSAMLDGEKPLPFALFLPGTFLDIVAGSLPAAGAAPAAAGAATAGVASAPPEPVQVGGASGFTLSADDLDSAELLDEPPPVVHRAFASPMAALPGGFGGASAMAGFGGPPAGAAQQAPARDPIPITQGPAAHRAQFAPLPIPESAGQRGRIDLLAGLEMNVSVELGRTELTVAEVLGLGPGSVIELDRLAGEPVDILVNDRIIARGEVVVVDENFGVRVVEVIRRTETEERAI